AEEAYVFDSLTYTSTLSALNGWSPTTGVTVVVGVATGGGWSATASHSQTTRKCYLFYGNAAPLGSATAEGKIHCS
ncbi:MAG TPA: pilin, partial [Gemmatimonadales bacterium]|nr:pilin [Gemmatimonadales bacterium]